MFRFTIRELVLLTLVVAMGVGWWVDRSNLVAGHDDALRLLAAELYREFQAKNPGKEIDIRVNGGGISLNTSN